MASSTATSATIAELSEAARRRPGAAGVPVRLADGHDWLLAVPRCRPSLDSLTTPGVDLEVDRIFESSTLQGEVNLVDAWSAARTLLLANYIIDDDEFVALVYAIEPGPFVASVVEALFGHADAGRSYTDWARASLLANGIVPATLRPGDLANVLSILVATRRTLPASQFIDASRAAEEQAALEALI